MTTLLVFIWVLTSASLITCARDFPVALSSLAEMASLVDLHTWHQDEGHAASVDTFCRTSSDGVYKSPYSPSSFIRCTHGRSSVGTCEPGLVWESTSKCCTTPWSTLESATGRDTEVPLQQPATPFCHNKPDGMYASPSSSSDFVHCTLGVAFTLHCNRDLVWDKTCNCCNLPQLEGGFSSHVSTAEIAVPIVGPSLSGPHLVEPAQRKLEPSSDLQIRTFRVQVNKRAPLWLVYIAVTTFDASNP